MIIRHLVLPENLSGTEEVLRWSPPSSRRAPARQLYGQYFPAYKSLSDPALGRKITPRSMRPPWMPSDAAGLENGWMQEHDASRLVG